MIREEAKQQVEAFFRRLGEKASIFDANNHAEARIGETVLGFELDEEEGVLSVQALIYRFRSEPRDEILDAVFAQENDTNSGGGRLVFNSENRAFYLQMDFREKTGDNEFYESVNNLAQASLRWNGEILTKAAEKAN